MGKFKRYQKISRVRELELGIASLTQELLKQKLNDNFGLVRKLNIRQPKSKSDVCDNKKHWIQYWEWEEYLQSSRDNCKRKEGPILMLDGERLVRACKRNSEELKQSRRRCKIFSNLAYYVGFFHGYISIQMDLPWGDLTCVLSEERTRMRDGAWWEEFYHSQLLGHLEALGFSKEEWLCSLTFAEEDSFGHCPLLGENKRALNDQLGKDKELLNSEEAKEVLSPAQIHMLTKVIEAYENQKFF